MLNPSKNKSHSAPSDSLEENEQAKTAAETKKALIANIPESRFLDLTQESGESTFVQQVIKNIPASLIEARQQANKPLFTFLPITLTKDIPYSLDQYTMVGLQHTLGGNALGVYVVATFNGQPLKAGETLCIPKGQSIARYVGEMLPTNVLSQKDNDGSSIYYFSTKGLVIDAQFAGNSTRCINHSPYEANLEAHEYEGQVQFTAKRDIYVEELLFNYGPEYFTKVEREKILHLNPRLPGWMSTDYIMREGKYTPILLSEIAAPNVVKLMRQSANQNIGLTPLLKAIFDGDKKSIEMLLSQDKSSLSILQMPILFLDDNNRPFPRDHTEQVTIYPLALACLLGSEETVDILLSYAETILNQRETFSGKTGAHYLLEGIGTHAEKGRILEKLFARGFEPDTKDNAGITALHLAVFFDLRKCVEIILSKSKNPHRFINQKAKFSSVTYNSFIALLAPEWCKLNLSAFHYAILLGRNEILSSFISLLDHPLKYSKQLSFKQESEDDLWVSVSEEFLDLPELVKNKDKENGKIEFPSLFEQLINHYLASVDNLPNDVFDIYVDKPSEEEKLKNKWYQLFFSKNEIDVIPLFFNKLKVECETNFSDAIEDILFEKDSEKQETLSLENLQNPAIKILFDFIEFLNFVIADDKKNKQHIVHFFIQLQSNCELRSYSKLYFEELSTLQNMLYYISEFRFTNWQVIKSIRQNISSVGKSMELGIICKRIVEFHNSEDEDEFLLIDSVTDDEDKSGAEYQPNFSDEDEEVEILLTDTENEPLTMANVMPMVSFDSSSRQIEFNKIAMPPLIDSALQFIKDILDQKPGNFEDPNIFKLRLYIDLYNSKHWSNFKYEVKACPACGEGSHRHKTELMDHINVKHLEVFTLKTEVQYLLEDKISVLFYTNKKQFKRYLLSLEKQGKIFNSKIIYELNPDLPWETIKENYNLHILNQVGNFSSAKGLSKNIALTHSISQMPSLPSISPTQKSVLATFIPPKTVHFPDEPSQSIKEILERDPGSVKDVFFKLKQYVDLYKAKDWTESRYPIKNRPCPTCPAASYQTKQEFISHFNAQHIGIFTVKAQLHRHKNKNDIVYYHDRKKLERYVADFRKKHNQPCEYKIIYQLDLNASWEQIKEEYSLHILADKYSDEKVTSSSVSVEIQDNDVEDISLEALMPEDPDPLLSNIHLIADNDDSCSFPQTVKNLKRTLSDDGANDEKQSSSSATDNLLIFSKKYRLTKNKEENTGIVNDEVNFIDDADSATDADTFISSLLADDSNFSVGGTKSSIN